MSPDDHRYGMDPVLYDAVYAHLTEDVAFYLDLARRSPGPVLEAACGTGRVLLPVLEAGVDIDGFDLDEEMLARLRTKAEARGLSPRVVQADLRDFSMPRRYTLAMVPFRAFLHLLTTEDQLAALRCLREHLESGGALVLNLFYPNFDVIAGASGAPKRTIETVHPDNGHTLHVYDLPRYDRVRQRVDATREIVELDADGREVARHPAHFELRWIWAPEMELLLRTAGFARWEVRGGFDGRPLERDTDEMIWTAWKD